MAIVLGMMQVSKKIPLDDPFTLNVVRGVYLLSNIIILVMYGIVHMKINAKKGTLSFSSPSICPFAQS